MIWHASAPRSAIAPCCVPYIISTKTNALTENFLQKIGAGACRVHGGGFAGTIQVFLPQRQVNQYQELIEPVFQKGCAQVLSLRSTGMFSLTLNGIFLNYK